MCSTGRSYGQHLGIGHVGHQQHIAQGVLGSGSMWFVLFLFHRKLTFSGNDLFLIPLVCSLQPSHSSHKTFPYLIFFFYNVPTSVYFSFESV
jgi:hypothetical protein